MAGDPLSLPVSETQFGIWRNSPETKFWFRYLEDMAKMISHAHLDRWSANAENERLEAFESGRHSVLMSIPTLRYDDVRAFYKGEMDATKAPDDDKGPVHSG